MSPAKDEHRPSGWAAELASLFQRLKMTSGVDPGTGKPLSLRQIAKRSGYVPSHVRDVINGIGRPGRDAVIAVAGALNASAEDQRLAAFYAEQLRRAPAERVNDAGPGRSHIGRPVPRELPHDVRGFTGRGDELAHLDHLSRVDSSTGGAVVIFAIDGTAGVGKTALAVHFAHRVADRFPDGQLHVNLRGFDAQRSALSPAEVLDQFLRSLGIGPNQIPADGDERARLYRSVLADRRILLLLDNAADAEQVRPLLPGSRTCLALVTSRNRLSGLVARDGAHRLAVDVLDDAEALTLLAGIGGDERIAAEPQAAAELARLAGHLPLALRIVAERLASRPHLRLADLVDELSDERDRLDVLRADGDERTAVRAVFSWSYHSLPPGPARLFRRLGLHAGPDISTHAAAALMATTVAEASRLLDALTVANLLDQTAHDRYRFHDLVRLYSAERASTEESEPDRAQAVQRMNHWYLHTADAAARILSLRSRHAPLDAPDPSVQPLTFTTHAEAMHWCEAERRNLLAVIHQAFEAGDRPTAWKLPTALSSYFYLRQRWADWTTTHHIAITAARQLQDPEAEAWTLLGFGIGCQDVGRFAEALDSLQSALPQWQKIGKVWGEVAVLAYLGVTYLGLRQIEPALEHAHRAIAIARRIDDPPSEAASLFCLAQIHRYLRQYDDALQCLERALAIYQRIHSGLQVWCITDLASVCRHLGRYDDAIAHCRQALAMQRDIGDRRGQAANLDSLGKALRDIGDLDQARQSWSAALDILENLGDPRAADVSARLARLSETPTGCIRSG